MHWFLLLLAGCAESCWPFLMKRAWGESVAWKFALPGFLVMALAMGLMFFAQKSLHITIAYPIFVGMGMAGTFFLGVVFLGESVTLQRLGFVALIAAGIVGLVLTAK